MEVREGSFSSYNKVSVELCDQNTVSPDRWHHCYDTAIMAGDKRPCI